MKYSLLICVVVLATVVSCFEKDDVLEYRSYLAKYNKRYPDTEFDARLEIYLHNREVIEKHNADKSQRYTMGINKFADMFPSELKRAPQNNNCFGLTSKVPIPESLPTSVDWRTEGYIPAVQNEGECGTVGYFMVAQQVSAQNAITNNLMPPPVLSVQQMVDCTSSGDGCSGGNPWPLYEYVEENGLETEASYPYVENTQQCKYNKSAVVETMKRYQNVTGETDFETIVANHGPISAIVDASNFQMYTSGVFTSTNCNANQADHLLLIVGYGTTHSAPKLDYWIAQNVWGEDWGMDGYILIEKGKNLCGIESCGSYIWV